MNEVRPLLIALSRGDSSIVRRLPRIDDGLLLLGVEDIPASAGRMGRGGTFSLSPKPRPLPGERLERTLIVERGVVGVVG